MCKKLPLVSIIIACYNSEDFIDMCLKTIVNQTYLNLEIIICDDASTDNSYNKLIEWKEKDSRIILLKNESNVYAAATRNRCIEVATGEYMMIQDIDDLSDLTRVEKLVNFLMLEQVDFVSSAMAVFEKNPNQIDYIMKCSKLYPKKKDFLWNLPFFHPATMFKKEVIKAVNGYRVAKETRRGQDYDMFMRMYALGHIGMNISEPLYLYRVDENNIKRRTFEARIDEFKIRIKGFKQLGLMPIGYLYALKPFVAYIVQKIKYLGAFK